MKIPVTAVVPQDTPKLKTNAIEHHWARPVIKGGNFAEGSDHVKNLATENRLIYIEEGENLGVMAGAGTLGLEMMETFPNSDILVIPVGGDNLISGMSIVIRSVNSSLKIIDILAKEATSVFLSLQ